MKKFLPIVSSLFVSAIALATPAVGDSATYAVTIVQQGQTFKGTGTLAITAKTDTGYELTQTTVFNGQTSESKADVPVDNFLNDETIADIMANCVNYGGKLEKAKVAAGEFDVCNLNTESGTVAVGKVPLGIVTRFDKVENDTQTLELTAYTAGK
ncbi:MAG TPA: hypothetical protein VM901_06440 [Bdellovibrionota bacterium]|nr:hypothetical protein [Bdellovibrionota bacterium]